MKRHISIAQKLSLLNKTTLDSLDVDDIGKIVKNFAKTGTAISGADFVISWYKKTEQKKYELAYASPHLPFDPIPPRYKGFRSQVENMQTPHFDSYMQKSSKFSSEIKKLVQSYVIIPICYKNNVYGNMVLYFKKRKLFSEQEKSLCAALGNSAAHTITINRLGQNLKQEKQLLAARVEERTQELVKTNELLKQEVAQRRITQKQLQHSQHFIEQITNVVPGLIAVIDLTTGNYIYMNDTVQKVLGYKKEDLLKGGTTFAMSLVHPDDAARITAQNNAALKKSMHQPPPDRQEPIVTFEYRMKNKRGQWRWLNTYAVVFHRAQNRAVTHILNISVDITDRKQMEETLKDREMLLSEAQSIAHIGSWEWDVKSNKIFWSDELCRIYGVKTGFQPNYDSYLAMVHPEDREFVAERIQKVRVSGGSFEHFHRIIRADNSIRTVHAQGTAIFSNLELVKMIGTGQDVTEQKNAEEKLKAYTRQLEKSHQQIEREKAKADALLTGIGEGILATDKHGFVILINPAAEKILGQRSASVLGKKISDVQELYDNQQNLVEQQRSPVAVSLKTGKIVKAESNLSLFYKKRDGSLLPLSVTAAPVRHNKEIIGAIQVFRDVAKEKEIDRAKSELISLASHQLRTPLSAINWYGEALLKEEVGSLGADQKRYLTEIAHANQKMVELVYDFLNISRMELGTFHIKLEPADLMEISKSVLKECAPIMSQKKLRLVERYGKNLESLEIDRKVIRIVLQNLLTNAIKYTKPKGTIQLSISYKKTGKRAMLYITVKDNGYGIPKSQQDKVFTKLFRADNIRSLDTDGTGLGLYMVKSFLDYIKGKVWFVSKENKGSTFFVELPAARAAAAPAAPQPRQTEKIKVAR